MFEIESMYGNTQPYLETMYKAAFALAYYAMLRVEELMSGTHPIQARDVKLAKNKYKLKLVLRTSKTHGKNNEPQILKVAANSPGVTDNKFFCLFKLVGEYILLHSFYLVDTNPFLVF